MDNNNTDNENVLKERNKPTETKNRTNEKLKKKRQEKLVKVRRLLQERLTSKLTFFQSLATSEKTPRHKAYKKSVEPAKESTDQNEAENPI